MRRPLSLGLVAAALVLLAEAGVAVFVYRHVAFDLPPALSPAAGAAAMDAVVAVALRGGAPTRPSHPELERALEEGGPVVASVWVDGRRMLRVEGRGPTYADATWAAARALAGEPGLAALDETTRRRARVQLDVVVARAPLYPRNLLLRTFGLVGGMDGVGARLSSGEVLAGADELVYEHLLSAERPLAILQMDIGLDLLSTDVFLARRARLRPGEYGHVRRGYFRFRAETFLSAPGGNGDTVRLVRGLPPGPPVTRTNLLQAALAGGRFLAAHLAENGRFVYELDLVTGQGTNPYDVAGPYSLPRHAGTSYYLAEIYGATRDPSIGQALDRALQHMVDLVETGGCQGKNARGEPFSCLVDRGHRTAALGSTALAVIAFAEARRATGDVRHDELIRRMTTWLLDMQLAAGHFAHLYDVTTHRRDETTRLLYFDGEAALALVRAHEIFGDPRYLRAAERALDALIGFYDFFAGRFFFGEEHWTCIAAEAAWPHLSHDRYREFCSDYATFLREQQFRPGETPEQPDLVGAYGITPFLVPHNTPAGSRTEAMISAYQLTVHHGRPDPRIRAQVLDAARYLLRQQVREDNRFFSPVSHAVGAIPTSAIDRRVRIDYVQHACSALLRAAELVAE